MEDNYREVKKAEPCLKLIHMDQVEVEEIEWLFYPFIPYGKVTIIQGDPGEGKTTVVLQIIAKLTKGEAILSETSEGKSEETGVEPINVIYQTAEDGLGDTIKPRLLAAGADCSRVLVIDDQDQPLTMVDARLEEAIIQTKARLVVLDPIQGFLGAGVDIVVVKHFCNTLFENSPGISSFKWCFPIIVGMRTDMIVPYVHISV